MGCSASKPVAATAATRSTPNSEPFYSPSSAGSSPALGRAFSLPTPLVHHPPVNKGDTHHLVSLTSTTYGSLLLIDRPTNSNRSPAPPFHVNAEKPIYFSDQISLSPDSVINTWELMDGLDDDSDSDHNSLPAKPTSDNGFKGLVKTIPGKIEEEVGLIPTWSPKKPLWKHISEESLLAKLDPNVASTYTRALSSRQLNSDQATTRRSSSFSSHWQPNFGDTKNRAIVIYFTSLRGIRKTYEDCCFVRTIFRGFRVLVDERDISMDSLFRKEMQEKLGGGTASASLPQVFMGGKHIGGAEEIRQMNESGELAGMLKGFPAAEVRSVCGRCGDARFVPCVNCNGSRKLFGEDGGLRRCPKCNENGLIRCPFCCCL
ncbi:uncharacterized protein At3g28850 [Cucumis sativus]|uniref:Glutaredoxin domain-containing protein n=1 Tax=Cucumis sativus TaxID=3659 RepID=A0A0A0KYH2_CUCSA|nr:uncharacterized protein At3g28850 [Cucumis sativus]KGN54518.1 hypothetical protein Csa_012750 [Cucumis sativus]